MVLREHKYGSFESCGQASNECKPSILYRR